MALALEQLVKQLSDSGIIAPGKLEHFIPPQAHPKDAEELLRELFKQNLLTKFQAQQVAAGKAKSLILGEYTILDKIGAGGMGQVFKAVHRRMDRMVAIKMLPPAMTKDAAAVARFEREVRAAAKLSHPNIVHANDAGQSGNAHFLVMEYVEGQDLSALVKKNGPFPVAKAVNYILQAARGLEFAHGEGVVHRDIKPANLLLDKKGVVKILDMGLARIETGDNAAAQAELTGSGAIMGTVDYMAPEQALSTKHADAKADIYSLGCSLFYLIAGKPAYEGETVMGRMLAHRETPIPSLRDGQADVTDRIQAVFEKMVAKTVEDRYQTMSEVIADLEPLVGTGSTTMASTSGTVEAATSNSNLTFLRNAAAGPTVQRKSTKQVKQPRTEGSGGFNNKRLARIGGAVLGVLILAGVIVSLRTNDGTLMVEDDAPMEGFALDFNGTSDYVATPVFYNGSHPITIEAKVTPRTLGGTELIGDSEGGGFGLNITNKYWTTYSSEGGPYRTVRSATPCVANKQTHFAGVFDGIELRCYVDGVAQPKVISAKISASACPIVIGAHPDETSASSPFFKSVRMHFDGTIDEVRISKVARYTGNFTPEPRFTPDTDTIALYHFDEGRGDKAFDSSSNGQHAQIMGAKWVKSGTLGAPKPPTVASTLVRPQTLTGPAPPLAKAPFTAAQAKAHQGAWAKHLGTQIETSNSVGMKMVLIPPGEFLMGSTDEQIEAAFKMGGETREQIATSEGPQRRVVITEPFLMGATEVTVGQFRKFSAAGYQTEAEKAVKDAKSPTYLNPGYAVTDDSPVAYVTLNDAIAYCSWLSEQEKATYRLPTEEEWEYACRAGTTTLYSFGDNAILLDQYGWHIKNSGGMPHPVGTKKPNAFGLYDMHGNLIEFWHDPPVTNRVFRGGCWTYLASRCRSASRYFTPTRYGNIGGFRVVRILDIAPEANEPQGDYALEFNDKNAVEIPSLKLGPDAPVTLEAYITVGKPEDVHRHLVGIDGQFGLRISQGGHWGVQIYPTKDRRGYPIGDNKPLVVGQRTHVAGVWTGVELLLFVDGKRLAGGKTENRPLPDSTSMFTLGGKFVGLIDEVHVSKAIRYSADFMPQPRFENDTDTLALYHFDEGTGDVLHDASDHGHDGKIVGATWVRAR